MKIPWKLLLKIVTAETLLTAAVLWLFGEPARHWVPIVLLLAGANIWLGHRLMLEFESSVDDLRHDLAENSESLNREREELGTLMSAISDSILAVDSDGVPLFYNSRFALLFGNDDRLRNRDIRVWEMIRAPEVLEAFRNALGETRSVQLQAIPIERDGVKRFFSISVAPLLREGEKPYGAVGIFHDVTELKTAEQIRIDFVANVSHELRTPLTSIKGYTDTLIQDSRDGRQLEPEYLQVVARNSDRLMSLIGDLLDLSSIESTDVLQKSQVSTDELTQRVVKNLMPNFDAKNQKVVIRGGGASVVNGEPRRLEQVLINLLDNASKYSPVGGQILVSWETLTRAPLGAGPAMSGAETVLRVKDNGPGIPREHQARLFERFYRVDKARSREQGGTGLGLAIVKHILQKHGGSASVESVPGEGATFICRFPA